MIALCSFQLLFGERGRRTWLAIIVMLSLAIGSADAQRGSIDAESWRGEHLESIAQKIQNAGSDDELQELVAKQSWLRRWQPGEMSDAPKRSPIDAELVEEPLLEKLTRPTEIDADVWQQMIDSQTKLIAIDTDDDRKENLQIIIALARQLGKELSEQLPSESQQLPESTAWVLAHTRYRLGRSLAYRELPVVRERWPIADPDHYQEQLVVAYQRLIDVAGHGRPEFILLEDRMLRRAGKKGRALELLEANQQSIEAKWYLKKRRDLLQELGWEPAYQEAARRYLEAGYRDEP